MNYDKQRHGCLAAWLVFMIIGSGFTALVTPFSAGFIQQTNPSFPSWVLGPMALFAALNIVFAVALFNWKKWGFYGFAATTACAFVLNLVAGMGMGPSLSGLIGLAALYGVLQIGGDRNGWLQLE